MVAFDCTHLPAMLGDSVGAAFWSETGAEKVSVMGVLGGTFWVPAAGVADCRANDAVTGRTTRAARARRRTAGARRRARVRRRRPADGEHDRHGRDDNRRAHQQHPGTQAQRPACPGFENVHGLRSLKTSPHSQTQSAPASVWAGSRDECVRGSGIVMNFRRHRGDGASNRARTAPGEPRRPSGSMSAMSTSTSIRAPTCRRFSGTRPTPSSGTRPRRSRPSTSPFRARTT